MKALIFSEGNGYGHAARDKLISDHFDFPIMTFGKGVEYCANNNMDFIEIPSPYILKTSSEKVKLVTEVPELIGFLKPDVITTIKNHFSKVDFVIVDGSPLGLAMAAMAGKKSIYITNDTSAIVGINGLLEKKLAFSLLHRLLKSTHAIIVPDFPPPLTITINNLDISLPLKFAGPFAEKLPQKKGKKVLVTGNLEKIIRPFLGEMPLYGSKVGNIKSYYSNSSVVICHGGHTTIMEALSYGKPVICIVDRNYPERYQNALMLEKLGVGVLLEMSLLSKQSLLVSIAYAQTLPKERLSLYKKYADSLKPIETLKQIFSSL